MNPFIVSIQTSKVKSFGDKSSKNFLEKYWESGSFKETVNGEIFVSKTGLIGDEVADKIHHGGVDKAVFANSFDNYKFWEEFLGISSLPFGALAENLTISGLDEKSIRIGDKHIVGELVLEVSQPRKPCWKISRRWENINFTNEIYKSRKTGWYYRVLNEGKIKANDKIIVIKKEDSVTIFEANETFDDPQNHKQAIEKLLNMGVLAESFKNGLIKRINGTEKLEYMKL